MLALDVKAKILIMFSWWCQGTIDDSMLWLCVLHAGDEVGVCSVTQRASQRDAIFTIKNQK